MTNRLLSSPSPQRIVALGTRVRSQVRCKNDVDGGPCSREGNTEAAAAPPHAPASRMLRDECSKLSRDRCRRRFVLSRGNSEARLGAAARSRVLRVFSLGNSTASSVRSNEPPNSRLKPTRPRSLAGSFRAARDRRPACEGPRRLSRSVRWTRQLISLVALAPEDCCPWHVLTLTSPVQA